MKTKKSCYTCQGFTLVEIVAVLIILGMLAGIAVPRFIDMTNEAKIKAAEGAMSSGKSQINMQYARDLLSGNAAASSWSSPGPGCGPDQNMGDYEMDLVCACGPDASSVTITSGPNPPPGGWPFGPETITVCQ